MTTEMELVVGVDGVARCIYDETLDLRELGKLQISRASHVEPDRDGFWWADMGPSGGPVLGPFRSRSEALGAERTIIEDSLACRNIQMANESLHSRVQNGKRLLGLHHPAAWGGKSF
jgi:hypothetical protein